MRSLRTLAKVLNFEQLYTAVEQGIAAMLEQFASGELVPPVPSDEKEAIFHLSVAFEKQTRQLELLKRQLHTLEKEYNVDSLWLKLETPESYIHRYAQALVMSERMRVLSGCLNMLEHEQRQLHTKIEQLQSDDDCFVLEQALEKYLDLCDDVARTLTEMTRSNAPIFHLFKHYQALNSEIERLFDLLDSVDIE